MPRVVRRGSKYAKRKPQSSKKAYSNYGKAAKAKRTALARVKRAKPASKAVKTQVVANARAIARLNDSKYGPLQTNYSHMPAISGTGGSIHVTSNCECLFSRRSPLCELTPIHPSQIQHVFT